MTVAELITQLSNIYPGATVFSYDPETREADEILRVDWDSDGDVMLNIGSCE